MMCAYSYVSHCCLGIQPYLKRRRLYVFAYVKSISLFFFLKKYFYLIKINRGKTWNIGSTFYTCAAVGRVTANLTSDVTVYNSTREEKHDRRSQPKHVTNFMADG